MSKRYTRDEFISLAIKVHGGKYNYSQSVYINQTTPIKIICPIHGEFWQLPYEHLRGRGCCMCGLDKVSNSMKKSSLYGGLGINDLTRKDRICVKHWRNMMNRCYGESYQKRNTTYIGCTVCDEWHIASNFKKWFDKNYVEGYVLDKDIIIKGNKVYSPESCCFVPEYINNLLLRRQNDRGELPIGVTITRNGKYYVRVYKYGKACVVGTFTSKKDAFNAYKKAKEEHIKRLATELYNDGKINKNVYKALMNYEVEIND